MSEPSKELVVAPTAVADYVASLVVVTANGKQVAVPINAEANRLQSQVVAALARELMQEQLKLYAGTKIKLKALELKALMDSVARVEENARFAYTALLSEKEGGEKAGTTPAEMMKAAAEGMATASHKAVAAAKEDRMKAIMELGKPKKLASIIEVNVAEEVA